MVSSFLSLVFSAIFSRGAAAFTSGRHPASALASALREVSGNARLRSPPSGNGECESPFHFRSIESRAGMSGDPSSGVDSGRIRYLGSGNDAIIRPGVVMVAPTHEYDHFLMKSAVFIYAIGLDEDENTIIRGVVLDHPTAFSIGEMSPNIVGSLSDNTLFRGGYDGSGSAMMLHSAGGPDGPVKSQEMIGSSGIFEGGIVSAMESADAGAIEPQRCKFFFNHMQFTAKEIENMFAGTVGEDGEDGDEWVSLEVPAEYVLNSDYSRSGLWFKLRSSIRKLRPKP